MVSVCVHSSYACCKAMYHLSLLSTCQGLIPIVADCVWNCKNTEKKIFPTFSFVAYHEFVQIQFQVSTGWFVLLHPVWLRNNSCQLVSWSILKGMLPACCNSMWQAPLKMFFSSLLICLTCTLNHHSISSMIFFSRGYILIKLLQKSLAESSPRSTNAHAIFCS